MENSKIEWTDHTFNPWSGCAKVSPGCANCYAEKLSRRTGGTLGQWGKGAPRRRTSAKYWAEPLKWNDAPGYCNTCGKFVAPGGCNHGIDHFQIGRRPRVFCASLADWLDEEVPVEWLADLLELIRATPNLDWLLLTKRPENWMTRMKKVLEEVGFLGGHSFIGPWLCGSPPPNVWIGTSVEDQQRADVRIPRLLEIPAKVRFLSCEPLLGPVDLLSMKCRPMHHTTVIFGKAIADQLRKNGADLPLNPIPPPIHWVIAGGESGPGARPMHQDWARSLRDQCAAAGVAFFMKQMGGTRKPFPEIPEDILIREVPNA